MLGDLLCGIWHSLQTIPTRELCQEKDVQQAVPSQTSLSSFFMMVIRIWGFEKNSLLSAAMWEARLS